ncbi:hypothetical protein NPIL_70631 [Nephila pilipes]|uniref:Uncharacterized protein n=1 Tax=Nephila pilipes TaxID=299642 RepID=A0A8X6K7C2_NEPPI|nr:hypothetical protein NPIL_70631 [Nephila pilipes]
MKLGLISSTCACPKCSDDGSKLTNEVDQLQKYKAFIYFIMCVNQPNAGDTVNGLHFDYSEDVFIDYRKQLDRSWRPSEDLFVESNGRSNHRFFLIM